VRRLTDEQRTLAGSLPALKLARVRARVRSRAHPSSYLEYLCAAYLGLVDAAGRYDPARGSFLAFASRRVDGAILDYQRRTRLVGSRNHPMERRRVNLRQIPEPSQVDPPEARRLSLWCDTAAARAGLSWRVRVWLYLWLVERWSFGEVARVFLCTQSNVSQTFRRDVPGWVRCGNAAQGGRGRG
jgi:RNA polymerase sigma factor (sigma-70 family)